MKPEKTEYEQECQDIFEQIRHFIGTTHQCPGWLSTRDLYRILGVLLNEDNRM